MCIRDRYRPGEDDPHLKVLQAAHISDDEYFSHMVRDDLNLIIRDIRENHKKDSESAPQTTVADELKENLEAVENFKGSRDEKLVVLYCKQLGINYKNLSDEEFRWLIRILKNQRKWERLSARGKNDKEKPLLHGSVSYTHLDVYKRQRLHRPAHAGDPVFPDDSHGRTAAAGLF